MKVCPICDTPFTKTGKGNHKYCGSCRPLVWSLRASGREHTRTPEAREQMYQRVRALRFSTNDKQPTSELVSERISRKLEAKKQREESSKQADKPVQLATRVPKTCRFLRGEPYEQLSFHVRSEYAEYLSREAYRTYRQVSDVLRLYIDRGANKGYQGLGLKDELYKITPNADDESELLNATVSLEFSRWMRSECERYGYSRSKLARLLVAMGSLG